MTDDLRPRVTAAIYGALYHVAHSDGTSTGPITPEQLADAVMTVVQPEIDRLRDELGSVEETAADREQNALHWQERTETAEAALAEVKRLCDLTIASSCRVQAIEQAEDTLAAIARVEASHG